MGEVDKPYVYINAGAGDLYFAGALLEKYGKSEVHAIDIEYIEEHNFFSSFYGMLCPKDAASADRSGIQVYFRMEI